MPERKHSLLPSPRSKGEGVEERAEERKTAKRTGRERERERLGWGRVCSGQYHLLLFIVASARCPFVIYVCFMARRIRKHLIKDGRVVGREEEATCATGPGRAGSGRLRKGHCNTSPRNSLVFPPPCCNCGHGFTSTHCACITPAFLFSVLPTFC